FIWEHDLKTGLRNVEALPRTPALVPRLPQTTYEHCAGSSGDLLPPSPPAEKATAREDQAGQASTGDGAGDGVGPKRQIDVKDSSPPAAFAVDQLEREVSGRPAVGGGGGDRSGRPRIETQVYPTDYQRKPIVMCHRECLAIGHRDIPREIDQRSNAAIVHKTGECSGRVLDDVKCTTTRQPCADRHVGT